MASIRRMIWLIFVTGCLNAPTDKATPRATNSLRVADILSMTAGLNSPTSSPKTDPQAVRLTVTPLESTGPVGGQCLLVASVSDSEGQPRHNRRIEWRLTGAGSIGEIDEGLNGRGRKVDDRLAIGQTVLVAQTLRRGNGEEIKVLPGQSWCIITSPAEGDSVVTVAAPEIVEQANQTVTVTRHWTEVDARFPAPSVCPSGLQPVLVTQVLRSTDRQPLAGYRVRYRVLDGAPAVFLPNRMAEAVMTTDVLGEARVCLGQVEPQPSVARLAMEVFRPEPIGSAAGRVSTWIVRGETTIEWQTAQVSVNVSAPPSAAVGQDVPIAITIANIGRVPSPPIAVALPLVEGMQVQFSEPIARTESGQLVWNLPGLAANESRTVRAVFRAPRVGLFTATAAATTRDGLRTQAQTSIRIANPDLRVRLLGPRSVAQGDRADFDVEVSNPSDAPATNVVVRTEFDSLLEHPSRANRLEVTIGTLEPRQTKTLPLPVVARQSGRPRCRARAWADGNLQSEAEAIVAVSPRSLAFSITGPTTGYVDRPATWEIRVANPGELPLTNVQVRVVAPAGLCPQTVAGGQRTGSEALWRLDELRPGEERKFSLIATPTQLLERAALSGSASADGVAEQKAEAVLEALGMPVLRVELVPPAPVIEIGKKAVYTVRVSNQGSLAARGIAVSVAAVGEPPCLRPMHGTGPSVGRASGSGIVFAKVPRLDPKQTLTYLLDVAAEQPGDGRLRVEMTSETAQVPVIVEEATRVLAGTAKPQAANSTGPGG